MTISVEHYLVLIISLRFFCEKRMDTRRLPKSGRLWALNYVLKASLILLGSKRMDMDLPLANRVIITGADDETTTTVCLFINQLGLATQITALDTKVISTRINILVANQRKSREASKSDLRREVRMRLTVQLKPTKMAPCRNAVRTHPHTTRSKLASQQVVGLRSTVTGQSDKE